MQKHLEEQNKKHEEYSETLRSKGRRGAERVATRKHNHKETGENWRKPG